MSKINPNEAPKGFIATKPEDSGEDYALCKGCYFNTDSPKCKMFELKDGNQCSRHHRKDGSWVIFVKVE